MSNTDNVRKQTIRIECINPILNVKDLSVSREYYVSILGFKETDWGRDNMFTSMERDKAGIYLCQNGQGNSGTWIWIGFDGDMTLLYEELKAKGAIIRQPPTNYSWALEMHVEDPDGHVLRFGTEPNEGAPYLDKG
jgi:predicted lactoylglutathione lyase